MHLNQIIEGKRAISLLTALRLQAVLGSSDTFWLNLQTMVDVYDARHSEAGRDIKRLKRIAPFARRPPTATAAAGRSS